MSSLVVNNVEIGNNSSNSDQFTFKLNSNGNDTSVLELHKGKLLEVENSTSTKIMDFSKGEIGILKPRNIHNPDIIYNIGDRVKENNIWYVCLKQTPVGITVFNKEYWSSVSKPSVIQTGVSVTYNDLADKQLIWVNANAANGITIDILGKIDDVRSYSFYNDQNTSGSFCYIRSASPFISIRNGVETFIAANTQYKVYSREYFEIYSVAGPNYYLVHKNKAKRRLRTGSYTYGTTFGNAPIYTNSTGYDIVINIKLYVTAGTGVFLADMNNTANSYYDQRLDGSNITTGTANLFTIIPPETTFRFVVSSTLTVQNFVSYEQAIF